MIAATLRRSGRVVLAVAALATAPVSDAGAVQDPDQPLPEGMLRPGVYGRVFSEGASGSFFDTRLHLVYVPPDVMPTPAANVTMTFIGPDGTQVVRTLSMTTHNQFTVGTTVTAKSLNVPLTEFSIVVESDQPIAVRREMVWDGTAYGSHATTGGVPSTTWHFAEGATIAGLQTFYLLGNISDTDVLVTADYLLSTGVTVSRTYTVAAHSRKTIWANQEGAPLDNAEFAASFRATGPFVAERAMYLNRPGQLFSAGSAVTGVHAPARYWLFAEGSTGYFFDEFLLFANTTADLATVSVTYLLPTGATVEKTHLVAPRSRYTVWVDHEDPALASTAVSAIVQSDVSIVAERAMWWPGLSAADWEESHAEVGATTASLRWATDSGESAYTLIANPGASTARVSMTVTAIGSHASWAATLDVAPTSRTTLRPLDIQPSLPPGRYSVVVESLPVDGGAAVPIVVEHADYSPDWRAGSVTLATPLP